MSVNLVVVPIEKPEAVNLILGQAHFIKTVEDLHEALVTAVPGAAFGLAFCESSGPCLVRWSGTDEELIELARRNALAIGAGHSFLVLLRNCYPINVLPAIRALADNGCLVAWTGEEGVRMYAFGQGETRYARNILRQAWLVSWQQRTVSIYDSLTHVTILTEDDILTSPVLLPDFSCRVSDIFQQPTRG